MTGGYLFIRSIFPLQHNFPKTSQSTMHPFQINNTSVSRNADLPQVASSTTSPRVNLTSSTTNAGNPELSTLPTDLPVLPPPSNMSPPEGVSRFSLPGLLDIVTVTSPHYLRLINDHPDIGRPDQGSLPSFATTFLSATQFHSPVLNGGTFCLPFTTTACNDSVKRLHRVVRNLKAGFSEQQKQQIAALVSSDLDAQEVARRLVHVVGPTVVGLAPDTSIPDDIISAMGEMNLEKMSPMQYFRARRARKKIEDWVSGLEQFKDEPHIIDIVHDLVNVYLGFTRGLMILRDIGEEDAETHLCNNAILPVSARTPLRETTLDGLFPEDRPLRKDRTVIVMKNGEAAKQTHDLRFVFGMGNETRLCPFRHLFMETSEAVVEMRK